MRIPWKAVENSRGARRAQTELVAQKNKALVTDVRLGPRETFATPY